MRLIDANALLERMDVRDVYARQLIDAAPTVVLDGLDALAAKVTALDGWPVFSEHDDEPARHGNLVDRQAVLDLIKEAAE